MLDPSAVIALLPLFLEKADSPVMVKHGLDNYKLIKIPVLACDCPIFILLRKSNGTFHITIPEAAKAYEYLTSVPVKEQELYSVQVNQH